MIAKYIFTQGLLYSVIVNAYLFLFMISTSPRVWGYNDYPDEVKNKVPPQTKKEKSLAALIGVPWIIFSIGFPIFSTYTLKASLGHEIPFLIAFFNMAVLLMLVNLGDLVILDWLIVSKITPKFVIIPGSAEKDYKDFSHHYKGHVKATIIMMLLSMIMAAVISYI